MARIVPGTKDIDEAGTGNVTVIVPSTITNGQKSITSGTAVALSATSVTIQGVVVIAKSDNTGDVFVGDSGVDSSNGAILPPGAAIPIDIDDLNKVFIDGDTTGDAVSFLAVG